MRADESAKTDMRRCPWASCIRHTESPAKAPHALERRRVVDINVRGANDAGRGEVNGRGGLQRCEEFRPVPSRLPLQRVSITIGKAEKRAHNIPDLLGRDWRHQERKRQY